MGKNNYRNSEQDRRITDLEERTKKVFDHIATINEELGSIKTDINWLKRFFWVIIAASVGGLVGALINLLITTK